MADVKRELQMTEHANWSRALAAIGLVAMLIGGVDPLEGSIAILAGVGLVTLAALLSRSRWLKLLSVAFALTAAGIAAMVVLSSLGGIGGESGRSLWWAVVMTPYPLGAIVAVAGFVLLEIELS
jgi:hypothetical protein